MSVVVAGASLGGLRAAEQLRAAGWSGPITVVGAEPHMPYNRPPLSKGVLAGKESFESLAFRPRAVVADVEWVLGTSVTAANLRDRVARLADGTVLSFDGLVVATGVRPRRLPVPGPARGRHVVRTVDDARALRVELARPGARVVVVGAGFIGCEVAATAVALGAAEVTVADPEPLPMLRPLGELVARELLRRHERHGVRFALGAAVTGFDSTGRAGTGCEGTGCEGTGFESAGFGGTGLDSTTSGGTTSDSTTSGGSGFGGTTSGGSTSGGSGFGGEERVTGVVLADGRRLAADVVVEAVGSIPNTAWLAGNGLDLTDGVLTDELLRAGGLPYVVAVGDVARFPNARYDGVPRRVEHWSMPADTARRAARTLAAHLTGTAPDPEPFAPLPTFWSDQHDFRLQSFGAPALGLDDVRVLDGQPDGDLVAGYHRAGRLVGVVALGASAAGAAARHRSALLQQPALTA